MKQPKKEKLKITIIFIKYPTFIVSKRRGKMKFYSYLGSILCLSLFFLIFSVYDANISSADRNVIKVVSLGDSITYGTGDSFKKGYIGRFKEIYERKNHIPMILTNNGVPKYTTEDILHQLEKNETGEMIKDATYITLYVGTNDFRKSAQYDFSSINVDEMQKGKIIYLENLTEILEEIRKQNQTAPIFVMGLYDPYTDHKNHKQLSKLIESWNTDIKEIVTKDNYATFVPTSDVFIDKPKNKYFADSLHLNRDGYHKLAIRLYETIDRYEENMSQNNNSINK